MAIFFASVAAATLIVSGACVSGIKKKYLGKSFEDFELNVLVKIRRRFRLGYQKKQQYKKWYILRELSRKGESQYPTLTERHRQTIEKWLNAAEEGRYSIDYVFNKMANWIMDVVVSNDRILKNEGNMFSEATVKRAIKYDYDDILQALFTTKNEWKHTQEWEEREAEELGSKNAEMDRRLGKALLDRMDKKEEAEKGKK